MRKLARKLSLNEQKAENRKAETYWASSFGKPLRGDAPMPKGKRAYVKSEIPTESQEQRAFVKWWRLQYPTVRIVAIPNGGTRDPIEAAHLKAEGVTAGFPDLIIVEWKMVIEFKRIKGSAISDAQRDWETYFLSIGWTHFFAYGCNDAIAHVKLFVKYLEGK